MLPGKRYTPEDIVRLGLRRKWFLVLPLVVATVATAIALRYVPDLYRSQTMILVVPQRVPDTYVRATVTARIEDRLRSINQQILSRTRLEPMITELGLYPEMRQRAMEDIVNRMRKDISVETVRGDAFEVAYVSPDPLLAQKVTERLASLFIEENLRDREVLADATSQFLESQLTEARDRLVEHEKRLEAYRLRYAGELPTQAQSNLQSLQSMQVQLQGLTDSVARDRDRRMMLERQLSEMQRQAAESSATRGDGDLPLTDVANLPEASAQRQLAAARQLLSSMETRLRPEHPDIIRTKRTIGELEVKARAEQRELAAAAASSDRGDSPAVSAARTAGERAVADLRNELQTVARDITSKEANLARVQQEIDGYRSRLAAVPTRESEMVSLMRDYDTLRAVYTDLLAKRENSKVAADLERREIGEQFRVLDPARRPEVPFYPNRPYYTAAGAVAGLFAGLAMIALLEFRDTTFRRDEDVVLALGLPVIAVVPRMMNADERRRQHVRLLAASSAAVVLGLSVAAFIVLRLL